MSTEGFIKIHRGLWDHPLWHQLSGDQFKVMLTMVYMANWKDADWFCTGTKKTISIPRGSFVATQNTIASRAGVSRKVVRTTTQKLLAEGFIEQSTVGRAGAKHIYITTVRNYDRYQGKTDQVGPRSGPGVGITPGITAGTPGGPDRRSKEVRSKNIDTRNESDDSPPSPAKKSLAQRRKEEVERIALNDPPRLGSIDAICGSLRTSVQRFNPKYRTITAKAWPATLDSWRLDIDKLERLDGVSWRRQRHVLKWLLRDEFWRKNILSAATFREKFDRLEGHAGPAPEQSFSSRQADAQLERQIAAAEQREAQQRVEAVA